LLLGLAGVRQSVWLLGWCCCRYCLWGRSLNLLGASPSCRIADMILPGGWCCLLGSWLCLLIYPNQSNLFCILRFRLELLQIQVSLSKKGLVSQEFVHGQRVCLSHALAPPTSFPCNFCLL